MRYNLTVALSMPERRKIINVFPTTTSLSPALACESPRLLPTSVAVSLLYCTQAWKTRKTVPFHHHWQVDSHLTIQTFFFSLTHTHPQTEQLTKRHTDVNFPTSKMETKNAIATPGFTQGKVAGLRLSLARR